MRDRIYSRWNVFVIYSRKLFLIIKLKTRDIFVCMVTRWRGRIKGLKARDSKWENFRFYGAMKRSEREREREREGSQGEHVFSRIFLCCLLSLFFFFFFFFVSFNVLNPRFQFFRRCPLPWHRRLLSPPLCLLLWFRISVLAFGYLKKS